MNNLFLFTGEETFLLFKQLQAWREAFEEKHGELNLVHLDGTQVEIGEIIASIEAAPFLGEKRLIIVDGLPLAPKTRNAGKVTKKDEATEKALERLIEFLPKIPESSVVVFVQSKPDKRKSLYKKIVQLGQLKEFNSLSPAELSKWIQQQAHKHGSSISAAEATHLSSLTGQDLWRIDNELKKLATYCLEKPIDRKAIDQLVVPTIEANIFHLTDALGIKDQKKAIQNLHRSMAAGENLRQIFYMIVRQFRLFLQIGGYLSNYPNTNPANLASTLKIHPFVARNTMGQLKHFQMNELKKAHKELLEIDVALKSSKIRVTTEDQDELALAIERFILGFCR